MASTTVAQFAAELNRPAAALLEQLQVGRRRQGVDRRLAHRERQGSACSITCAPRTAPSRAASARRSR